MNLGSWSIQLPLVYVAIAAMLYWVGGRGFRRAEHQPLADASFIAGLLTIVIALESPIDAYADQLFWVHMLQHVLLLTVAPPLILLGRPWPRMWRALPLKSRTAIGRDAGALALDCAGARAGAAVAGVDPVQRDVRRLAHTGRVQPDPELEPGPRPRARDVLLHGAAVLGARDRPRPVASAPDLADADRVRGQRDGRRLGARDHARARPAPALPALRDARPPARAGSRR